MKNDEDLAIHEIMQFLRYLLVAAEVGPFDLTAHIPRIETLIKNYDRAVSREVFSSISEGLVSAIGMISKPVGGLESE